MKNTNSLSIAALALLIALFPKFAGAADDMHDALLRCADVAAATARLECFDRTVAEIKKSRDSVASRKDGSDTTFKRWFGLTKPVTEPADFGKPPPETSEKVITSIESKVVEATLSLTGRLIVILENGQVWKQIDGDTSVIRFLDEDPLTHVSIERGALGSYMMDIKGRPSAVKVRRIK